MATVLFATRSAAQQSGSDTDSLPAQFNRYQAGAFQEKLFIHTDKTFYLAGETLWFKAYDVDGYFNRPMTAEGVAYLEIVDQDSRIIFQESLPLHKGTGNGSWAIPPSVASGNYMLRAYTSWMKNFSADFFYHETITIVNSLNATGSDTPRLKKADIRFFPEGGHLVEGLTSRVAFKAVDEDGNGIDCDGVVVGANKDTIVRFRSRRFGMGSFLLSPEPGVHYRAFVRTWKGDSVFSRDFPTTELQGYVMQLEDPGTDRLKITVRSDKKNPDDHLHLFTHTRHLFKSFYSAYMTNGQAVFFIDKKTLGDGISHVTLFNGKKIPVCERLYFKIPGQTMTLDIQGLSAEYETRQKINLSLVATDPAGRPVVGDLSMSVFLVDSLQTLPSENILSSLLLTSDLRGKIECPSCYFADTSAGSGIDDLMLTQGWSRFDWGKLLSGIRPPTEFLPEMQGPVINGKIIDKKTGLPAPGVTAYLSAPGPFFEFSTATSRPDGALHFHTGNWIGNKELIVQANSRAGGQYRVDITSPFSDKFALLPLPNLVLTRGSERVLNERSIDVQAENSYRIADRHRYPPLVQDTVSFYGHPDLQFLLADYTKFGTLEEVMKEYVGDVRLRRQSGKFYYRVRNAPINLFFEDDPLLLLDGIPVFDADKLLALDPSRIKKIDVMTRKYFTGPLEHEGIISYRSVEGDLGGYTLDPDAVVLEYYSLAQAREFYAPQYNGPGKGDTRLPDFRNQLQWSPSVRTDLSGKTTLSINTSDRSGRYVAIIQGFTADGLLGATAHSFSVKK